MGGMANQVAGKSRKGVLWTAAIALTLALLPACIYLWGQFRLNKWIYEDIAQLSPYPTSLVTFGEPLEGLKPIDEALVEELMEGRWVVELTRSEYRKSLLGNSRWVKVHLVTARNVDSSEHQAIKLLNRLDRTGENWKLASVEELTLP